MKIMRRNLETGETRIITCEQAYNEVARDNKEELDSWAIENAALVEDLILGGGIMEFDGYEYGEIKKMYIVCRCGDKRPIAKFTDEQNAKNFSNRCKFYAVVEERINE